MCGFAGLLSSNSGDSSIRRTAEIMAGALTHRGPDDSGSWANPNYGIALGHQRLSILDTTEAGHQPMLSASERYVIAFNGEI